MRRKVILLVRIFLFFCRMTILLWFDLLKWPMHYMVETYKTPFTAFLVYNRVSLHRSRSPSDIRYIFQSWWPINYSIVIFELQSFHKNVQIQRQHTSSSVRYWPIGKRWMVFMANMTNKMISLICVALLMHVILFELQEKAFMKWLIFMKCLEINSMCTNRLMKKQTFNI